MTDILLRASILKDQMLDLAAFARESSGIVDQLQTEIKALREENERLRKYLKAALATKDNK